MPEVVDWLKKLGMSEYAQRFAENDIDFAVLSDLTDQDLDRTWRTPSGIAEKCCEQSRELDGFANRGVTERQASAQTAPEPALRHCRAPPVTVMFSDLVGSTALSARMDPEDLREIISAYQNVSPRPCSASAALWRSTWATVSWYTLVTRKLMRTTPSGRCGLDLSWLVLSVRSSQTRPCKSASALPLGWSWSAI